MSEKQPTFRRETVQTYEVDDDQTLSEGVVAAVAAVSDTDPAAMDPLAEFVDPDALNGLFADQYDGTSRSIGSVRFPFFGHEVVVGSEGYISVLDGPR